MPKSTDKDLEIASHFTIPDDELAEAASRSGGPGGQNVNKTNTRVSLRWNVRTSRVLSGTQRARLLEELRVRLTREGELIVHADRTRSRARNRDDARQRIVELLSGALAERETRRPTAPSRASKLRVKKQKTIRSEVKRGRGRVSGDDS